MTDQMTQKNLRNSFTSKHDGCPAAIFDNTVEHNNFTLRLQREGLSFRTKIIKVKRAGKKRREFVVMLVDNHEH